MIITKKRAMDAIFTISGIIRRFSCSAVGNAPRSAPPEVPKQLERMSELLQSQGKEVTGLFVTKTGVRSLVPKSNSKNMLEQSMPADCILTMACGAGTQTVVELFEDKRFTTVNDTLFLGNMTRLQQFHERCSQCGECILDKTGGICPVTACRRYSGRSLRRLQGRKMRSQPRRTVRMGQEIRTDE